MSVLAHSLVVWLVGLVAGTLLGFVIGARGLTGPGAEDGRRGRPDGEPGGPDAG